MPLLTDEELMALEEDLLARERGAPIAMPETAQAPAILPPGPSLEYLRRAHELGPGPTLPDAPPKWGRGALTSFDPATGQTESFTTISPPRSASADYLEQIRNQINATEFKTQADALNAAIQFQHMREFQRLSDAGVPPEQALLRTGPGMFGKNPNVIAPLINATRPVPSPAVTNIGGVNVLRSGLRGERATAIPRTALETKEFKPEIIELGDGERAIQLAPNRYQYLKPVSEKDTPPAVRERILKHQIEQAQAEIQNLPTAILPKARAEKAERIAEIEKRIKEANDTLNAMVKGTSKPASSERVKVISPTGKRGDIPRSQLDEAIAAGYKLQ